MINIIRFIISITHKYKTVISKTLIIIILFHLIPLEIRAEGYERIELVFTSPTLSETDQPEPTDTPYPSLSTTPESTITISPTITIQPTLKPTIKPTEKPKTTTYTVRITHYCACNICCGYHDGRFDSGKKYWRTADLTKIWNGMENPYIIAASFGKFGDKVIIKGIEYTIRDRLGSGMSSKNKKIDIFVPGGHQKAKELSVQRKVKITYISKN